MPQKIIIAGAGWYGCHIAFKLQHDFDITIIEKKSDIFDNSSFYNQNRLHLGFHYPRNFSTRNSCKEYYDKFTQEYGSLIDNIDNNYYAISDKSLLDYKTYLHIYEHEGYEMEEINNTFMNHVDGNFIKVKEKVINSSRAKEFFKSHLCHVNFMFDNEVVSYHLMNDTDTDAKVSIQLLSGQSLDCDYFIDCTYNQLQLSNLDYTYELTLSLLYKQNQNHGFEAEALTIMDGNFSSLFPREKDKGIYTLTDVEFTPLFCSKDFKEVEKFVPSESFIEERKMLMENKFIEYYPNFLAHFDYQGYFLSHKTKLSSGSAFRDTILTEIAPQVFSVNCGKIYGIFKFENFIRSKLN